jgi:hypothetical protein
VVFDEDNQDHSLDTRQAGQKKVIVMEDHGNAMEHDEEYNCKNCDNGGNVTISLEEIVVRSMVRPLSDNHANLVISKQSLSNTGTTKTLC